MKEKVLATALLLTITGSLTPVKAQETPATTPTPSNQVLNACRQNRADTLPIPFSDVSPNHWAFKAVMTMYYCGAFREATTANFHLQGLNNPKGEIPSPTASQQQENGDWSF